MIFHLKNIQKKIILFCLIQSLFSINVSAIEPSDYTQPEVCGGCHAEIYSQWNGSMHAVAHKDIAYQKLFIMASMETNSTFDEFCTKCHAPIATLSGEIPSADDYQVSPIADKGVSCDFCHTVNASSGIGNGAFISSPGNIKYGPFNDSNYSTFHSTAYSELHTKSEFCGMCHNVVHPFNGLILENTYTEWKESPYNETTSCQHCHMTPGVTEFRQNPGRVAAGGPVRDHVYTHYFVGGNAMLPGLLGSAEHERLAKERLRSAAKLEIENIERINETVNLKIKVTNSGAGHKLPTGLTEARLIWTEIVVRDNSGRTIFSSGEMDDEGHIEEDAVKYQTVFGDSTGKHTEKVWLADRILSDNRILPKGYSTENYEFMIPENAKGPLTIAVKLNYVSATQELSDILFGKGEVRPPVIEMASANATLDLPFTQEIPGFTLLSIIPALLMFYILRRYILIKR
jgi:hypothetical protein